MKAISTRYLPATNARGSRILATELTRTIRKWPSFSANMQRLVDLFVTHGVAIDYAPDDKDFRFEVAALDERVDVAWVEPVKKMADLNRRWQRAFAVGKPELTWLNGDVDNLIEALPEALHGALGVGEHRRRRGE